MTTTLDDTANALASLHAMGSGTLADLDGPLHVRLRQPRGEG